MALRKQYFRLNCSRPPNYSNQYQVAWLMGAEGVGKVVQVGYFLPVELDQDISRFEAGFGGRSAVPDVGEADALGRLIEIRDAAEVWAVTGTSSGADRT